MALNVTTATIIIYHIIVHFSGTFMHLPFCADGNVDGVTAVGDVTASSTPAAELISSLAVVLVTPTTSTL